MEIAIHIEPAERPFNWVDRPILVAIELWKMVVGEVRSCADSATPAVRWFRRAIETLRSPQHTVVHEICPRLHDGFWRHLLMDFDMAMGSSDLSAWAQTASSLACF